MARRTHYCGPRVTSTGRLSSELWSGLTRMAVAVGPAGENDTWQVFRAIAMAGHTVALTPFSGYPKPLTRRPIMGFRSDPLRTVEIEPLFTAPSFPEQLPTPAPVSEPQTAPELVPAP